LGNVLFATFEEAWSRLCCHGAGAPHGRPHRSGV